MDVQVIKSVVAMVGFYVINVRPAMDSPEAYEEAAKTALKTAYQTELPFKEYENAVVIFQPGWYTIGKDTEFYRALRWLPELGILVEAPLN